MKVFKIGALIAVFVLSGFSAYAQEAGAGTPPAPAASTDGVKVDVSIENGAISIKVVLPEGVKMSTDELIKLVLQKISAAVGSNNINSRAVNAAIAAVNSAVKDPHYPQTKGAEISMTLTPSSDNLSVEAKVDVKLDGESLKVETKTTFNAETQTSDTVGNVFTTDSEGKVTTQPLDIKTDADGKITGNVGGGAVSTTTQQQSQQENNTDPDDDNKNDKVPDNTVVTSKSNSGCIC